MQKTGSILLFLFLTGLFTGLFFSTCLSSENASLLSGLLLSGITDHDTGFLQRFCTSLLTNFALFLLMLPALLHPVLRPLPALILWYKSFAVGFCSGLLWSGARDHTLLLSLLHILPQNLFLLPGFFLCALTLLSGSMQSPSGTRRGRTNQKSNPLPQSRLLFFLILSALMVAAGSLTEAAGSLTALLPS